MKKPFTFAGLLVLAIIAWAFITLGAAAAAFLLVGPCPKGDLGILGARCIIVLWFIATPIYFVQTGRLAFKKSNGP